MLPGAFFIRNTKASTLITTPLIFWVLCGILLKISNVLLTKMLSVAARPEGRTGWHKYRPAQDAMTPGFILSSGVNNGVVVVLEYCARLLRRAFWSKA